MLKLLHLLGLCHLVSASFRLAYELVYGLVRGYVVMCNVSRACRAVLD